MYLPTEFHELLAYHLKNRGLTQRDFADKCGFSTGFPGNLVNGARTPQLDKLDVMAKALDLNDIERASFIESAHLAHCPQFIRDRLTQLRVQLSQVREELEARLDFNSLAEEYKFSETGGRLEASTTYSTLTFALVLGQRL